jgi:hypothetical protein
MTELVPRPLLLLFCRRWPPDSRKRNERSHPAATKNDSAMQQVKLERDPQLETDQAPRTNGNAQSGALCLLGPSTEVLQ